MQGVAPVKLHSLAAVQVQELFVEDEERLGPVLELSELILGFEVDVVGRVDGLGDAVDFVSGEIAAALFGFVFDVVDPCGPFSTLGLRILTGAGAMLHKGVELQKLTTRSYYVTWTRHGR